MTLVGPAAEPHMTIVKITVENFSVKYHPESLDAGCQPSPSSPTPES